MSFEFPANRNGQEMRNQRTHNAKQLKKLWDLPKGNPVTISRAPHVFQHYQGHPAIKVKNLRKDSRRLLIEVSGEVLPWPMEWLYAN